VEDIPHPAGQFSGVELDPTQILRWFHSLSKTC